MAWNRPTSNTGNATSSSRPAERGKMPRLRRGLIAGAIVVLGAGLAAWLLTNGEAASSPLQKKDRGRIKAVAPAVTNTPAPAVREPEQSKKDPRILGKTPTGEDYVSMTAVTNADGSLVQRFVLADGTRKRVISLQTKESQIFDHPFDNRLAILAETPLDHGLAPFPVMSEDFDKQFADAIKTPIIIKDTDSEDVRRRKELVKAMRQEICDLMREGYTVKQILAEHDSLRQRNIEFRHQFQTELNNLYKSGDVEAAKNYMETMNKALAEKGVLPLTMPGTVKRGDKRQ